MSFFVILLHKSRSCLLFIVVAAQALFYSNFAFPLCFLNPCHSALRGLIDTNFYSPNPPFSVSFGLTLHSRCVVFFPIGTFLFLHYLCIWGSLNRVWEMAFSSDHPQRNSFAMLAFQSESYHFNLLIFDKAKHWKHCGTATIIICLFN